jgi:hypothetical protein
MYWGTTNIGEILDEFFHFFNDRPDLWVMDENDEYTVIVRNWKPVQSLEKSIKKEISLNPEKWDIDHRTTSS